MNLYRLWKIYQFTLKIFYLIIYLFINFFYYWLRAVENIVNTIKREKIYGNDSKIVISCCIDIYD